MELNSVQKLSPPTKPWQNTSMKTSLFSLSLVAATLVSSGCITRGSGLVLDPVGPVQAPPTAPASNTGTLTVYSAYSVNADFDQRDPNRPECSDYKIETDDGKLLERVHNVSDDMLQNPVDVTLSPGRYRVVARANGYGRVTIPVVIAAHQNTVLHLEGGGWPGESQINQANAVHLPDGTVVGWRPGPGQ